MMMLVDACRSMDIGRILSLPDVAERVRRYHEHESKAIDQLRRCAHVQGSTVVLDMRNESVIYAANRFLVYALFPNCTMSLHVMWGREKANTVFALGRSIFNSASTIDIGDLCTRFGGGGHQYAGTCQIGNEWAEQRLAEVLARIENENASPRTSKVSQTA